MLTQEQIAAYRQDGYLKVEGLFATDELEELRAEMERVIDQWGEQTIGWIGPWRDRYLSEEERETTKAVFMHNPHFYSAAWGRVLYHPGLIGSVPDLVGPSIQWHHTCLHAKPPALGTPFPMHQDDAFYLHEDNRYVDVLVHLDETRHENGEIRFLDGSFKRGRIKHVMQTATGEPCTPHLPTDEYRLEDTVAVPAKRGDVVVFNLFTVHGSHINATDKPRRLVRIGYRHPENLQIDGQSKGRPSWIVAGKRRRQSGDELFRLE